MNGHFLSTYKVPGTLSIFFSNINNNSAITYILTYVIMATLLFPSLHTWRCQLSESLGGLLHGGVALSVKATPDFGFGWLIQDYRVVWVTSCLQARQSFPLSNPSLNWRDTPTVWSGLSALLLRGFFAQRCWGATVSLGITSIIKMIIAANITQPLLCARKQLTVKLRR